MKMKFINFDGYNEDDLNIFVINRELNKQLETDYEHGEILPIKMGLDKLDRHKIFLTIFTEV